MSQDKLPPAAAPPAREPHAAGSDAASNADGQSKLCLPSSISNVAVELGRNFGISTLYSAAACFAAISGAIGNSVRLRSSLWPRALNAALQWLFVDLTQGRLSQAIDFITQDLSELQNERLRDLSSVFRKRLEGQIQWRHEKEGLGSGLDPRHDSEHQTELVKLQLRLKPLRYIQDPPPGQLAEVLPRSGDHALLVRYSQLGLQRLCDAAKGKWAADLLALEHGWHGQTLITVGRKESADLRIVEPAVSSLIVCVEDDLKRLLETEPISHSILARMIPIAMAASAPSSGFASESLQEWRELITQLNTFREWGQINLLELDPEAEDLLMKYRCECQSSRLQPEQKFLAKFGPVLAAKLPIGYQLALSQRPANVSVEAMEGAIQLTRVLLRQGADSISLFPGFGL